MALLKQFIPALAQIVDSPFLKRPHPIVLHKFDNVLAESPAPLFPPFVVKH